MAFTGVTLGLVTRMPKGGDLWIYQESSPWLMEENNVMLHAALGASHPNVERKLREFAAILGTAGMLAGVDASSLSIHNWADNPTNNCGDLHRASSGDYK